MATVKKKKAPGRQPVEPDATEAMIDRVFEAVCKQVKPPRWGAVVFELADGKRRWHKDLGARDGVKDAPPLARVVVNGGLLRAAVRRPDVETFTALLGQGLDVTGDARFLSAAAPIVMSMLRDFTKGP
jgi:hypothetical protein